MKRLDKRNLASIRAKANFAINNPLVWWLAVEKKFKGH